MARHESILAWIRVAVQERGASGSSPFHLHSCFRSAGEFWLRLAHNGGWRRVDDPQRGGGDVRGSDRSWRNDHHGRTSRYSEVYGVVIPLPS